MKALFLGISLLNIVFFFWEFHKGALNPPAQTPQSGRPTIMLIDELEKARHGAEISTYLDKDMAKLQQLHGEHVADKPIAMRPAEKPKKAAPIQAQPIVCHEVGPFPDEKTANAWLAGQTLRGEFYYKEVLTPTAYLVYYPAAKSSEQTRIQKMMINAKGITDIWVVPDGELKGALSLGLFNDQAHAAFFRGQLLQRGVQAEIKERYKSQFRSFVRIMGKQKIPQHLAEGLTSSICAKQ
ncbi:MAG: hypothetical protein LUQ11_11590 [Methylococcaceae bacterium]|nr:hypothetical protein [Methylococcaceae bacterium]